MEFRTTFEIEPSARKISYKDQVMFIGSCFASSIGRQFQSGKMPVMINPSGTVYNPVSVSKTLDYLTGREKFAEADLVNYAGKWISFDHYTDFDSADKEKVIEKINKCSSDATGFISRAGFLFITFGTARVYRLKRTGEIVSNCHKMPAVDFSHELLSVDGITSLWYEQLDRISALYPGLRVVFTISPIRHLKDGAYGNQLSKSILFLSVEKLLEHPSMPAYFPAYELVMDDLRDYRFYGSDMVHLSETAVAYIWDAFRKCYFEEDVNKLWNEVEKITKAVAHRIQTDDYSERARFSENLISRIDRLLMSNPFLDLYEERNYFLKLGGLFKD